MPAAAVSDQLGIVWSHDYLVHYLRVVMIHILYMYSLRECSHVYKGC